ncbi:MAG: LysR family transcriptional regulator [Ketobacter sp.]|nr:MAG: LysR family transcriptional regulator [Ketobacter sp.]
MLMDLKSLSYFVAAYEEANITLAARRCHVSQPSISAAVSALEENLGITVFLRHKRGVTATTEGDRLYQAARRLLSDAASLRAMFSPVDQATTFTLGLMTAINVNRVMALLEPLLQRQTPLDLRLAAADAECDARIVCDTDVSADERCIELWKEPFVVALPEGHALAIKPDLVMMDLVGTPLIAREYCSNNFLEAARLAGMEFNVVATAQSEEWAIALVNAGVGVAILPESYIKPEHKIIARSFSNMTVYRRVVLAYPAKTTPPVVLKSWMSELQKR